MKHSLLRHAFSAALLASLSGLSVTAAPPPEEEPDNATLRSRAKDEWYNESYGDDEKQKKKKDGSWSPSYRRFVLDTAVKEREKYAQIKILPDGSTTTILSGAASVTGANWSNLGPTRADVIKNGGYSLNKTDSGRIRSIVIDPTNASVIYLATAGVVSGRQPMAALYGCRSPKP